MAQKLLYSHEICSGIEEMGGEGMPEGVDAEALIRRGSFEDGVNGPLNRPPGQPASPGVHKKGIPIFCGGSHG